MPTSALEAIPKQAQSLGFIALRCAFDFGPCGPSLKLGYRENINDAPSSMSLSTLGARDGPKANNPAVGREVAYSNENTGRLYSGGTHTFKPRCRCRACRYFAKLEKKHQGKHDQSHGNSSGRLAA